MRRAQPWRTNRSRALRSRPVSAEAKLWAKLRSSRLGGVKFVRQAAIGPYFVDFLCRERKVVVEVDGGTHGTEPEITRDERRAVELRRLGYRIFRVHYENLERVLDGLLGFVEGESP